MTDDKLLPCECGESPKLYSGAGEFRLKCTCGHVGPWFARSIDALRGWNRSLANKETEK